MKYDKEYWEIWNQFMKELEEKIKEGDKNGKN